jgi:hypothetical protein
VKNPQDFNIDQILRSDLIFMTKNGLTQLEEVLESRLANHYRNKSIPRLESLPYHKYIEEHVPSIEKKNQEWRTIIKPTLEDDTL